MTKRELIIEWGQLCRSLGECDCMPLDVCEICSMSMDRMREIEIEVGGSMSMERLRVEMDAMTKQQFGE